MNAVNPASTATRMVTGAIDRLRARGGDAQDRAEQLEAALQPPEAVAVVIAALIGLAGVISKDFGGLMSSPVWPLLTYIWSGLLLLLAVTGLIVGLRYLIRVLLGKAE